MATQLPDVNTKTDQELAALPKAVFSMISSQLNSARKRHILDLRKQLEAAAKGVSAGDEAKYKAMAQPHDPNFAVLKRNFVTGNFWFWFGTFWKELSIEARVELLKAHFTPDGEPKDPDLNRADMSTLPPQKQTEVRTLLKGMMDKGFTPWKVKAKGNATTADKLLPKIDALGKQFHSVGFRGDARDPQTLASHDGGSFLPKAQSPYQINKYNMDAAWNPFSLPEVRNTMYWREGQADNDLFTVVSIAKDFATATKFPLINDRPPELFVDFNGATVLVEDKVTKKREQRTLPFTKMYMYMVIADEGFNTEEYQVAKFPEIGVGKVNADQFLACMKISRIHCGPDGDDGHIAYVTDYEFYRPNKRRLLYAQDSGGDTLHAFNRYMTNTYYHEFFEYSPLGSTVKIVEIQSCNYLDRLAIDTFNRMKRQR